MKSIKQLCEEHKCDKAAHTHHTYDLPYEFHFAQFRDKPIKLLEIGVGGYDNPTEGGASLRMWDEYFIHPDRMIYSIDIFEKTGIEQERIKIFKGSQTDEKFLFDLIEKIGYPDIIVDDGSHINTDVITSFRILFPLLKVGGLYVVEDIQTSYWHHYGGSIGGEHWNTSMNYFKTLVDKLNYKEIATEQRGEDKIPKEPDYFDINILSIHFYHNMVFIYKGDNSVTA